MPPKLTGKDVLERWRSFIKEHKTAPVESGGAGHALAECTRRKLAAGHLSRSEIAELNRLKGEASRASSTNSDEAHPAAAPGVGAEHGYRSGVEQPVAGEHAIVQSAKIHTDSAASQPAEPPGSFGIHHAADTTDINFEHCQDLLERQQEHIETLKSMLPDVKTRPSDSRIMELADRLKVPEQGDRQPLPLDLMFKRVQQQFHDEVCELQGKSRTMSSTNLAAKKASVGSAGTGSGGSHHASPSNRIEEGESPSSDLAQCASAKKRPRHTGRIPHTGSSDIEQLTDTRQELRPTMIFLKILEPIWAIEVADGQKMFECVANKGRWQNQFKQLASGDIIVICIKGQNKVSAVCEVASTATVKETNREVLKSKLQESRHLLLNLLDPLWPHSKHSYIGRRCRCSRGAPRYHFITDLSVSVYIIRCDL